MSKAGALVLAVAATAAAAETRWGPGQPFFSDGRPSAVALVHDGAQLIALAAGRLRAWDVAGARLRYELVVAGPEGPMAAAGERIALLGRDAVEVRRAGDGSLERTLPYGERPVQLAFADDQTLAEAQGGGGIVLVDVVSGARRTLAPPTGGHGCFAAGGGLVVACGGDRLLRWRAQDGAPLAPLMLRELDRVAVASVTLAVAVGGTVRLLHDDGRPQLELAVADAPGALALSADGRRLAVTRSAGVDVYDVASGRRLHDNRPRDGVGQVGFSADGQRLWARHDHGLVRGWRIADGQPTAAAELPLPLPRVCPAPHAAPWQMADDCRTGLLVDEQTGHARLWRAGAGETRLTLPPRTLASVAFAGAASGRGLALATLLTQPPMDPATGRALFRATLLWLDARGATRLRRELDGRAGAVALSPDGQRLALALDDGLLLFAGPDAAPTRLAQPAPVSALAFSPDGAAIALGLADGTVTSLPIR